MLDNDFLKHYSIEYPNITGCCHSSDCSRSFVIVQKCNLTEACAATQFLALFNCQHALISLANFPHFRSILSAFLGINDNLGFTIVQNVILSASIAIINDDVTTLICFQLHWVHDCLDCWQRQMLSQEIILQVLKQPSLVLLAFLVKWRLKKFHFLLRDHIIVKQTLSFSSEIFCSGSLNCTLVLRFGHFVKRLW